MSKKRRKKTKNGNITTKPHELTPEQERQITELQKIALKIEAGYEQFCAKVIKKNGKYSLTNVVIDGPRTHGPYFIGGDSVIEINDKKSIDALNKAGIADGDLIYFDAIAYLCEKEEKKDWRGLKDIEKVEKINGYCAPTRDELINEQIRNLICEICIFKNHCYSGICVANQDEVKEKFEILKSIEPGKFTPFTVMAAYEIWGKVLSQFEELSGSKADPNLPVIQEIKRLSSKYGTGYIWPAHDAIAHMVYPEFQRIYLD